jgi:hypothetical protein
MQGGDTTHRSEPLDQRSSALLATQAHPERSSHPHATHPVPALAEAADLASVSFSLVYRRVEAGEVLSERDASGVITMARRGLKLLGKRPKARRRRSAPSDVGPCRVPLPGHSPLRGSPACLLTGAQPDLEPAGSRG